MHKQAAYGKAEYILQSLEQLVQNGGYQEEGSRFSLRRVQKYRMQDLFLQLHNHHGSVKNSTTCFRKLLQYSDAVGTEELVCSINRGVQVFFNQFDYETVINLYELLLGNAYDIRTAYRKQREMTELVIQDRDLFGESVSESQGETHFPWIGKMLSSLGQAYAFHQQYEEAKKCFREAVAEFPDAGNQSVTNGHYLHVLIETEEKEQYLKDSRRVFGCINPQEQLQELLRGGIEGIARYNLYIWVKAAYRFDFVQNRACRNVLDRLFKRIRELCDESAAVLHQHPWELIFKYLYRIFASLGRTEEAEYCVQKCLEPWEEDEETLLVIKEYAAWECSQGEEKKQAAQRLEAVCNGMETMKGLRGRG